MTIALNSQGRWSRLVVVWVLLWFGAQAAAAPPRDVRAGGRAEINGTRLHYEVIGKGPPLVLLHAGLADARMWDNQVRYFSGQYTVIRFDVRGYGQSDPATAPYAPVDDLFALLKFLEIQRACVIGLSMGGTEAIDFAATHPAMVSGLVVVAGSPGWESYSDALVRRTSAILTAGKEQGAASLVERWLDDPMLAAAKRQPKVAEQMRRFLRANAEGILGTPLMRPPNIPTPKLTDFRMPTLVMVGDRDDPEIIERSRRISRDISGATLAAIHGAGHMVNLERPREFNRTLARFLKTLKLDVRRN